MRLDAFVVSYFDSEGRELPSAVGAYYTQYANYRTRRDAPPQRFVDGQWVSCNPDIDEP